MTKLQRTFVIPALATAIALGLFAFQALPALAFGGWLRLTGTLVLPARQPLLPGTTALSVT